MDNTCIICYDDNAYLKLCYECKYNYCIKCANILGYKCSICNRLFIKLPHNNMTFIDMLYIDNDVNNDDVVNQNIIIFIKMYYYLSILFNIIINVLTIYVIMYFFRFMSYNLYNIFSKDIIKHEMDI